MVVDWRSALRQASPTASVTMESWPCLPLERWVSELLAGGPCSPGPSPWKHILWRIHNQNGPRDRGAAASHPQIIPYHICYHCDGCRLGPDCTWIGVPRAPSATTRDTVCLHLEEEQPPAPISGRGRETSWSTGLSCIHWRKRWGDSVRVHSTP